MIDPLDGNAPINLDHILEEVKPAIEDDDVLRLVQRVRLKGIEAQLANGIPNTPDELSMLNTYLVEASKDAHKNKKLRQDADANKNVAEQTRLMADMYFDKMLKTQGASIRPVKEAIEGIPEFEPAHNETKIGDDSRSFDEFDAEVGAKVAAANEEKMRALKNGKE